MIKKNQSEVKNTLSEMRSILNEINNGINKVNKEEDQMTYIEGGKAKDSQSEWQEKRSQDYKNNLRSLFDTVSYTHLTLPTNSLV